MHIAIARFSDIWKRTSIFVTICIQFNEIWHKGMKRKRNRLKYRYIKLYFGTIGRRSLLTSPTFHDNPSLFPYKHLNISRLSLWNIIKYIILGSSDHLLLISITFNQWTLRTMFCNIHILSNKPIFKITSFIDNTDND